MAEQGRIVARGKIKVDARKAIAKLRDHLLVDLHLYATEIARVAVALDASKVDVEWDADDVILSFDGRALPAAAIARARDHVLTPDTEVKDGEALRVLGIGLSAALGLGPSFVDVYTSDGAGCARVRNYIQSGNVVFDADAGLAGGIAAHVSAEIARRFELRVPVMLRSARELRAVASKNPFLDAVPGASLYVMFLADDPGKSRVATLDPDRSPPDRFAVKGKEIYLACPQGVGKSKLTSAWFDAKLGTISTARNWNTILKLVAMCAAPP